MPTLSKRKSNRCFLRSDAPPTFRIYSGRGDFLIPSLSAWSVHRKCDTPKNLMEVDMEDIPGVWQTSSHKGIVSCNQLVRRTVPFILDAANLLNIGSSSQLLHANGRKQFLSSVSIGNDAVSRLRGLLQKNDYSMVDDISCSSLSNKSGELHLNQPFKESCFHWAPVLDNMEHPTHSYERFQLAITGMKPKSDFVVVALIGERKIDITDLFEPIPSLTIREPHKNR